MVQNFPFFKCTIDDLQAFFWLVGNGVSTSFGYLMQTPLYTYTLNIYDLYTHFVDNIFK